LISPFYLFQRITKGNGEGLDPKSILELKELREEFLNLTQTGSDQTGVFLAKVGIAPAPVVKSQRLPLENVLNIE